MALTPEIFEVVESAVLETVRGRWFLAEYARRIRQTETDVIVSMLRRIEAAVCCEHEPLSVPEPPAAEISTRPSGIFGQTVNSKPTAESVHSVENNERLAQTLQEIVTGCGEGHQLEASPAGVVYNPHSDIDLVPGEAADWDRLASKTWKNSSWFWPQVCTHVGQHWVHLTEDDLEKISGKREVLVERIQIRYGISRQEAQKQVADFEWLLITTVSHR